MVRPVEGPGGPGPEGPGLRLTELPPEMLEHMMEFMNPDQLAYARGISEDLQGQVDNYLEHLINSGRLTDREGNPVRPGVLEMSEILQNMENNYLRLDYQPPSEADVARIAESWDDLFLNLGYEEGTPYSISFYEPVLNQGVSNSGKETQKLKDELDYYVQTLLIEGRIVDQADNPLPADTSLRDVMELLRNGDATWLPPPNA
jgi:hypothetical protein